MTVVSVMLNGAQLDPAVVVADVVVRSGRSRADDGLSPASTTVELESPDPLGERMAIGDDLVVTADGSPRFTGLVAELSQATSSADASLASTTIVGIGALAALPRNLIPLPLPAATAAARAAAVFAACGIPCSVAGGATFQLAALGLVGDDPTTADQVVGQIMSDTGAVVADGGDGTVVVQFPEARSSGNRHTPDPEQTSVGLEWDMSDDLVNDATVDYPGAPAPVHTSNVDSVARYGFRSVKMSTGLGDVGSATRRATSLVSRLAVPSWQLGSVETWDPAALAYRVGDELTLEPLPSSAPIPDSSWNGILEGWSERYQPDTGGGLLGVWDLSIGDPRHSGTLVWSTATPTEHWSTANPATAWQEVISNADL